MYVQVLVRGLVLRRTCSLEPLRLHLVRWALLPLLGVLLLPLRLLPN